MAKPANICQFVILLLACQVCSVLCKDIYDTGREYEFKTKVPGGAEDCYFMHVSENNTEVQANFEVLYGGDQLIDFSVWFEKENATDNDGKTQPLFLANSEMSGYWHQQEAPMGVYKICIDNGRNKLEERTVGVHLAYFHQSEWETYAAEIEQLHIHKENFYGGMNAVTDLIADMHQTQSEIRMREDHDWYLITANNSYVLYWSLGQCILVVVTAATQVYAVRSLFASRL